MAKRKISVDEFVKDVVAGMRDSELMEKHRLSRTQLDAMFTKLLERGHLQPNDLAAEQPLPAWAATQELVSTCPQCGALNILGQWPCPKCGHDGEREEVDEPEARLQPTPVKQQTAEEPIEEQDSLEGQIRHPQASDSPEIQEEPDFEWEISIEPEAEKQESTQPSEVPASPQASRGGRLKFLLVAVSLLFMVMIAAGIGFYFDLIPFLGESAPPPPLPAPLAAKVQKTPEPALKTPNGMRRSPGALSAEAETIRSARVAPEAAAARQGAGPSPGPTTTEGVSKEPDKIASRNGIPGSTSEEPGDRAPAERAVTRPTDEGREPPAGEQPAEKGSEPHTTSVAAVGLPTPVANETTPTRFSADDLKAQRGAATLEGPPTLLIEGVKRKDLAAVQQLLQSGVDPNSRDTDGVTALMHAAMDGSDAVAEVLLKYGANANLQDNRGSTALLLAQERGNQKLAALLAGHEKDKGSGALLEAARNGQLDLVKSLLQSGANLNATDEEGNTSLMLAAERGHLEVVRLLLEGGADISVRNNNGATALSRAYSPGATKAYVPLRVRREMVRILKKYSKTEIGPLGRH